MYIPASGSSVWAAITDGFRLTDSASQDIADLIHSGSVTTLKGADATGDDLKILANRTDTYPFIEMNGNSWIYYKAAAGQSHYFQQGSSDIVLFSGVTSKPCIGIKECTTSPSTISNWGLLYTKSDNKLYFKDGDGTEHEVSFV